MHYVSLIKLYIATLLKKIIGFIGCYDKDYKREGYTVQSTRNYSMSCKGLSFGQRTVFKGNLLLQWKSDMKSPHLKSGLVRVKS